MSQPQPQQQQQPAPTNHFGGSLAPGQPTGQHAGQHTSSHAGNPTNTQQDGEDELIPTAIVIKNIPFAVKKEQLVQLMTDMNLPLPYAFNYHFDNGVFRGLAFANFTTAEETATVIEVLNHFELQGRKLRVEYKKMLPLQERERIEREKRERRGQLEEQHRPMAASQLQHNTLSHAPATSPSPVSNRNSKLGKSWTSNTLIPTRKTNCTQRSISTTAKHFSSTMSCCCSRRTPRGRFSSSLLL